MYRSSNMIAVSCLSFNNIQISSDFQLGACGFFDYLILLSEFIDVLAFYLVAFKVSLCFEHQLAVPHQFSSIFNSATSLFF